MCFPFQGGCTGSCLASWLRRFSSNEAQSIASSRFLFFWRSSRLRKYHRTILSRFPASNQHRSSVFPTSTLPQQLFREGPHSRVFRISSLVTKLILA